MVATIGEAEWALLVLGKLRNRRAVIAMFAAIAAAAVTGIALSAIAVAASALPALSLSTLCAVSASRLAATAGLSAATTSTAALGDRTRRSRRGARNRDRALGNAGDRGRARNRGCVADIAGHSLLDKRASHLVHDGLKQVTHHGSAAGLHEDLCRHARHQLLAG
jgi:hypothetical protein